MKTLVAITFDDLVEHGRSQGVPLYGTREMPWSFTYEGHPVTHENDDCYLVPTRFGAAQLWRGDLLVTGADGEIYPCKRKQCV